MDQIWQQLWNAGIPLFLLCIGIVVIWRQWREDMNSAQAQRDANIEAIKDLSGKLEEHSGEIDKLTKSLSDFFLKHFP